MNQRPPPILSQLRPADYVTFVNASLGILAIAAAWTGPIQVAYALILVAVLVDGLDGWVARATGPGPLGASLDALADVVSFVVAPAVVVWVGLAGPGAATLAAWTGGRACPIDGCEAAPVAAAAIAAGVAILHLGAGLARLARFEATDGGRQQEYFDGLTTPGAAIVVASAASLASLFPSWAWPLVAGAAVSALLMVGRRRLPKLRGSLAGPSVVVLLAGIAFASSPVGPVFVLAFSLAYVVMGPAYVKGRAAEGVSGEAA